MSFYQKTELKEWVKKKFETLEPLEIEILTGSHLELTNWAIWIIQKREK